MPGHIDNYVSKQERELAKDIDRIYRQAAREVRQKLKDFTEHHKAKNALLKKRVKEGTLSEEAYKNWLKGQVFQSEQWKRKLDDIVKVYRNADEKAREIVGGTSKNIFCEAANYTAFSIEKDLMGAISFNLYDKKTVERLIKDNPKMLPEWKINEQKDYVWNEKRVQNAVAQGIIQGESIAQIGNRLTGELATSNAKKMNLFARTAFTGAQNAGRIDRLHDAEEMGIEVKKKWLASLDDRTRDAHADLDGDEVPVDEPFHSILGPIMYPGDPTADPANVYNCRCTLTYVYPKYQHLQQNHQRYDREARKDIDYVTYKEWQRAKQPEPERAEEETVYQTGHIVVQGQDISETWERRADQFDFAINDVMNAQGFDGLPRIVSEKEFDKAVKESGFIAQRGYTGPNQETLLAYRDALYHGDWYVDCSKGGSMFGQGMYTAANFNGELSDAVQHVARGYGRDGLIETMTMTPNARFAKYDDIFGEYTGSKISDSILNNFMSGLTDEEKIIARYDLGERIKFREVVAAQEKIGEQRVDEITDALLGLKEEARRQGEENRRKFGDVGVYATARGYDAIVCGEQNDDGVYVVILNRTKVIFRRAQHD